MPKYQADATDIANAGRFLNRQLEMKMPGILTRKYADLWAERGEYHDVIGGLSIGNKSVIKEKYEATGEAKPYVGKTNDIPTVLVADEEDKYGVITYVLGYEYSFDELEAARLVGKDINISRIRGVDRGLKQKIHELAVFGRSDYGYTGIYNNPNVPTNVSGYNPNTASWQDHLDFFDSVLTTVADRNQLTEGIGYIHLPNKLRSKLTTTYQAGDSGKSAYQAIMDSHSVANGGTLIGIIAKNECRAALLEQFGVKPAATNQDRIVFLPAPTGENEGNPVERAVAPPMTFPVERHFYDYKSATFMTSSETIVNMPDSLQYEDVPQVV